MTKFLESKHVRLRAGKLIDVLLVSDPEQIQWLNQHQDIDRAIDPAVSWLHRFIDGRLRGDLGFEGSLLPIFQSRLNADRAKHQKVLEDRLENLRGLPGEERDEINEYVSGQKYTEEIGVMVQQWCGRLFFPHYRSDAETYAAGRKVATWPTTLPLRAWKDRVSGRLDRAKTLLSTAAEGDRQCIHGTSIGMENVARSVRKLRKAAGSSEKQQLSPDDILRECLVAPPAVLRGVAGEVQVPFLKHPLTKRTVIVFLVARAFQTSGDLDVAFLGDGWSRCPARRVIPEMMRAVWHAAHHDETEEHKRLFARINVLNRLWNRAVS